MRPVSFSTDTLAAALRRLKVASLPQLVAALGNPSVRTVFRKLQQLDYISSYSHRGRFYALRACARFDASGLWCHQGIRFSTHGTLRATVPALAAAAPAGLRAADLDRLLGRRARRVLRPLVAGGDLTCVQVAGQTFYCATEPARRRRQAGVRHAAAQQPPPLPPPTAPTPELAAAVSLFASLLNEKQRRLFAGLASLLYGAAGDRPAAAWLGLHPKTVRKGRRELVAGEIDPQRVRRPGGGRKPVEKKSPR